MPFQKAGHSNDVCVLFSYMQGQTVDHTVCLGQFVKNIFVCIHVLFFPYKNCGIHWTLRTHYPDSVYIQSSVNEWQKHNVVRAPSRVLFHGMVVAYFYISDVNVRELLFFPYKTCGIHRTLRTDWSDSVYIKTSVNEWQKHNVVRAPSRCPISWNVRCLFLHFRRQCARAFVLPLLRMSQNPLPVDIEI